MRDERTNGSEFSARSEVKSRELLADLLDGRRLQLAFLALISLLGGLAEALVLVIASRLAVAVTDGAESVTVVGSTTVSAPAAALTGAGVLVIRVLLGTAASWYSASLGSAAIAALRRRLASAFLLASWRVQHSDREGRLQELLTTFSQRAGDLANSVTQVTTSGTVLLALLGTAIVIDLPTALALAVAVAVLASILRPVRGAVRERARESSNAGMHLATSLGEISQLGLEIQVFDVREQVRSLIDRSIAQHDTDSRRLLFLRNQIPVIYAGLLYLLLIVALVVVASVDRFDTASLGAIMLVMLRSLSYGQAVQSHLAMISASMPYLKSIDEEINRYQDSVTWLGDHDVSSVGVVRFDNVSFEYQDGQPTLDSINLEIRPHEVIGIIGPSGSGKSTLVQLLLALREPTSGRILVDGIDLKSISRSSWFRAVSFVPQKPRFVSGSIAENVRFFREGISDEDVKWASRLANFDVDVSKLGDLYDAQVGESGGSLSGGQQQRLVIARALAGKPKFLILDEPTSALDARTEQSIRQSLNSLRQHVTLVIVAHRMSTLNECDRIMVLIDGQVRAFDTPDELERHSEFYRQSMIISGLR